jgi:hypothetical protein
MMLMFLIVAQQTISWSVIKYSKQISGQCNVTAQIEQVRDIKKNINGTAKKYSRIYFSYM